MTERMVPIAVRVPQSLRDQMEAHARYHNRKLSDEARAAWESHVARPLGALNIPSIATSGAGGGWVAGFAPLDDEQHPVDDASIDPLDGIA